MSEPIKRTVPFEEITKALLDNSKPFPAVYLHRFSDIPTADLRKLEKTWDEILPDRRTALLEDLEQLAENDTLLSMDDVAKIGLADEDSRVRQIAVRMLWETNDVKLISKFITLLENDPDSMVRASAATSLGQYIYLGELEEISENYLHQVEKALLDVLNGDDTDIVRRRALESMGFSSLQEVNPLIKSSYNTEDPEWISSALYAMGRSADQSWSSTVLEMLDHSDEQIQFEAVRAAGELGINKAREPLLEMLSEGIDDEELRMAVIWSLSKIGGEDVRETLDKVLEQTEDEEEAAFIEEAIDNLFLTEGFEDLTMFEFEAQDENDLENVINLEDEDENNTADKEDHDLEM